MVAMKVFQQNKQHNTVQKEEHVRSALRSIPLAYKEKVQKYKKNTKSTTRVQKEIWDNKR